MTEYELEQMKSRHAAAWDSVASVHADRGLLIAEVERLKTENDQLRQERPAVVAWLRRGMDCGQYAVAFAADHIERGEHIGAAKGGKP